MCLHVKGDTKCGLRERMTFLTYTLSGFLCVTSISLGMGFLNTFKGKNRPKQKINVFKEVIPIIYDFFKAT